MNDRTMNDRTMNDLTTNDLTMNEALAVSSLAALAQGGRLRIFRSLVGAGPDGLTPGTLSSMLGVPPSTLSFHLKELTSAGLVTQARDGRHLIYRPSLDQVNDLIAYLTAHCCQGVVTQCCAAAAPVDCATASPLLPRPTGTQPVPNPYSSDLE